MSSFHSQQQRMSSSSATVVHKTYNSPASLYSAPNAAAVLNQKAEVLANGGVGVDFRRLGSPNLAKSEVLKMVEEEEMSQKTGERRRLFRPKLPPPIPWPPKSEDRYSPSFFIHAEGIRKVAWPPPEDELVYNNYSDVPDQTGTFYGPVSSQQYSPNQQQQQNPNWATNGPQYSQQQYPQQQYPQQQSPSPTLQQQQQPPQQQYYKPAMSSPPPPPTQVQLRQETPIRQPPHQVYDAQPPVKRRVPFKCRGDEKWPPESWKMKQALENEERDAPAKPGRAHRDYRPFFAKNAINSSYPPYRPPPGTQHYYEYLMGLQGQL